MSVLANIAGAQPVEGHRPWPRAVVDEAGWVHAIDALAAGQWTLSGLWGDAGCVHMAVIGADGDIAVLTYACHDGKFPSVGAKHPPAVRLERAIASLFGYTPEGAPDPRPWLDHGVWGVTHPLGSAGPAQERVPYTFLPVEGEALHQVPVGPVHAGIIEPGHFRFTANGEFVVRVEERLGYVHKGIESLMAGATLDRAAQLAARTSGDSTVAYSWAFAAAAEAAMQLQAPPRAIYLRALMAEIERLANHLGDIGAVCNDASFALMHAQTSILRERVLRAAEACFGHRLMMDAVVPGGVARDLPANGAQTIRAFIADVRKVFPRLIELYDKTASLQDRTVTTGIVKPDYARQFGAGGFVGRAAGRNFDARRNVSYAPYDVLTFEVPVLEAGDVNARVWIRIREVEQSLSLLEQILDRLPQGDLRVGLSARGACEGMAYREAFRGDVLVWLRLDAGGRVARCHLRDASWFQWPLVEAAIENNIIADFPLCNKSFNCSYSGHDL
ncbi:MAG TPA: hydrogenase expression protein HypE [Pseudolabrys sp.]|nr:hydrogenase expression protein HypE [Pseudolabrys sp.]